MRVYCARVRAKSNGGSDQRPLENAQDYISSEGITDPRNRVALRPSHTDLDKFSIRHWVGTPLTLSSVSFSKLRTLRPVTDGRSFTKMLCPSYEKDEIEDW